jgi:hypothetical protein
MTAVRVRTDSAAVLAMLNNLRESLTPEAIDPLVEQVSFRILASVVVASPKKWFGQIKSGWRVIKSGLGSREVLIPESARGPNGTRVVDILRFVNSGTANDGSGYIYPKKAKRLYIPLTRTAAAGWREGLRYGVDYILRARVRGIKGSRFVEDERKKAAKLFLAAMKQFVRNALARGRRRKAA